MSACLTARGVVRRARADGTIELELMQSEGCRGCRGACLWRRLSDGPSLALRTRRSFAPGTRVAVSLPERFVLRTALLMHGVPWIGLLAGAALGAAAAGSDLGTVAGAVAGVVVALALTPGLRRRFEHAAWDQLELEAVE